MGLYGYFAGALLFAVAAAVAGLEHTSCGQHIGAALISGVVTFLAVYLTTGRLLWNAETMAEFVLWSLASLTVAWICSWFMARICYSCGANQGAVMATVVTAGYVLFFVVIYTLR